MVTVISYDTTVLTQSSESVFFLMKSINAVRVLTPLSHHSVSDKVVQMFQRQASLFASLSFFILTQELFSFKLKQQQRNHLYFIILTAKILNIGADGKL